jgi:HSP20 family protein
MTERSAAVQRAQEPAAPKPITFESLLERMNDMFNDIARRAFEIFDRNGHVFGHELDHWLEAEREFLHPVNIELSESGESLEMRAEVPGFAEKELEISAEPNRVIISGKRQTSKQEKNGKTLYSEVGRDQILRVVNLPVEIETEKVAATLKNGVLVLTLAKASKPRSIRIQPKPAQ